jgi:uncharacterized protein (DUF2235 family)
MTCNPTEFPLNSSSAHTRVCILAFQYQMRALFAGVYVSMRIVGYSSVRHPVCYAQHIAAERLNKSALLAAATTSYDTEALLFYFVDHIYQLSPAAVC